MAAFQHPLPTQISQKEFIYTCLHNLLEMIDHRHTTSNGISLKSRITFVRKGLLHILSILQIKLMNNTHHNQIIPPKPHLIKS